MDDEFGSLIQAWIERYLIVERDGDESEAAKSLFWSFEQLDRLVRHDADNAWQVILAILNDTDNDFVLSNLAAGPLEDLLAKHGYDVIARVEEEANVNSRFRELLTGVWKNQISDEVWEKVQRAASTPHKTH